MARVCPKCRYVSPVDAPYCPACGAPMDESAAARRTANETANAAALSMRWHKFLIFVSLPLSLVMTAYNLVDSWPSVTQADFSRVSADLLPYVKASLYLGLGMQFVLLMMAGLAEIGLARMRWRGVQTLLSLYVVQAAYAVVAAWLLNRIGAQIPLEVAVSAVETAVMFLVNRAYYRKRRPLFAPFPGDENGGSGEI